MEGQKGLGGSFSPKTTKLKPKKYPITLTATTAPGRRETVHATAQLVILADKPPPQVTPPPEPPPSVVSPPPQQPPPVEPPPKVVPPAVVPPSVTAPEVVIPSPPAEMPVRSETAFAMLSAALQPPSAYRGWLVWLALATGIVGTGYVLVKAVRLSLFKNIPIPRVSLLCTRSFGEQHITLVSSQSDGGDLSIQWQPDSTGMQQVAWHKETET